MAAETLLDRYLALPRSMRWLIGAAALTVLFLVWAEIREASALETTFRDADYVVISATLTQAQVDAMTTEQIRQEVAVKVDARRRARESGDEVLEQRMKTDIYMLMDRLRGGG